MLWFFSILLISSVMVSSGVDLPIHCEYPCQPPPTRPPYGTPPPPSLSPPSEPVYAAPPPPSEPVYDPPTPPTKPSCPPPPPAQPSPTGPIYGAPPTPLVPGNCQPNFQNCAYPPPVANIYQPVDSASHLVHNCLVVLVLMLLSFYSLLDF